MHSHGVKYDRREKVPSPFIENRESDPQGEDGNAAVEVLFVDDPKDERLDTGGKRKSES